MQQLQTRPQTLASLFANSLIAGLPSSEQKYMVKNGRSIELKLGSVLCEVDEPIQRVYFPTEGFISQTASSDGPKILDVGLVGNEGMLGATLLLDVKVSPVTAIVLGAGRAFSMSSAQFRRALYQSPKLVDTLNRYIFAMLRQWSQVAFCAHFHQVEARLARFLLTVGDRTYHKPFQITQGKIAKLLGVRRSSVTLTARRLQDMGLIQYRRGNIAILDLTGLEAVACSCYLQRDAQLNIDRL